MLWNWKFNSFSLLILFFNCKVNADEVPVILWNIKGTALQIQPVSALGHDDKAFTETIENAINAHAHVLVYALPKLSNEDFTSDYPPTVSNSTIQNLQNFLEIRPYMLMSSVNNPLNELHRAGCGVQEIVVDQNIDENVLQSVSLAFGQSCIVILHITDKAVFAGKDLTPDDIKSVFLPEFPVKPENVIAVFTSSKSSWTESSSSNHLSSRRLLQSEEFNTDAINGSYFANITGCAYMYTSNVTIQVGKGNNSVFLPFPPDTSGSFCNFNNETNEKNGTLLLTFKDASPEITEVIVKFKFRSSMGYWLTDATIELTGNDVPTAELITNSEFIEAPMNYSFNCGTLRLNSLNRTYVTLTMYDFQVQPFPNGYKFSISSDCVTFFTLPIWMGIFVSLLFVIIINIGIYALFSVNTMDRFDDPKGKTITVAVGGD